ncbi:MAG: hypothetical protein ACOCVF_02540 [bacterium]
MKTPLTIKQVKNIVNHLSDYNITYGGSFALKLCGYLNREIYDLDVIVNQQTFNKLILLYGNDDVNEINNNNPPSINEVPDDIHKKDTIFIDGVRVCLFVTNNELFTWTKLYDNNTINVLNPYQIILYKDFYLRKNQYLNCESNKKHIKDIITVIDNLKNELIQNILK